MSGTGGETVRKLASGAIGTVAGLAALLVAEGLVATYRTYLPAESAPPVEGAFGDQASPPLHLVMAGDSTAAGVGVTDPAETVGARLASDLAGEWRVTLSSVAVSGSRASDLGPQVSRALLLRPDVAVVLIGANDVTHATPLREMAGQLSTAVTRLREAGVAVVVGTCPYMGARAFLPPLRQLAAWQGRRLAHASAVAVHESDGSVVAIGELCGPLFRSDPLTLSADAFHPSAEGYRHWAEALAPAVRRAAGQRTSR
ncbi:MAG: SGNH/GDSL hydrolase family protein [Frankiaceae bacterium]